MRMRGEKCPLKTTLRGRASTLGLSHFAHKGHDPLTEEEEQQYVGNGHEVEDPGIEPLAYALLPTEYPALPTFNDCLAH